MDAAGARDIIQVAQGIYNEQVLIQGKSDIQLRGENAVLQGIGVGTGISIAGSSYIEVQGFIVDGYAAGIVLEDAHYSRIHDIETRNNNNDATTIPDALLLNGLDLIGSDYNVITNVFAHHNGHNGITLKDGSSNNTLRGNTANDNGINPDVLSRPAGCGIQLTINGDNDNSIIGNETLRNAWGILVFGGDGVGSSGNTIAQNISNDNGRSGIAVHDGNHDNLIHQNLTEGNAFLPNGSSDLFDQGDLNNSWLNNQGNFNHASAKLEFIGEGKSVAEDIEYIGHDGRTRLVASDQSTNPSGLDLRGHEFTFAFRAVKQDGFVKGFMQLDDPQLGITVFATDFEINSTHPRHKIPVGGFTGPDAVDMQRTAATNVYINGVLQPGWKFDNGPVFVGKKPDGSDVFMVCFEIRQPIGSDGKLVKTHQWHGFVTEGEVTLERSEGPDQKLNVG